MMQNTFGCFQKSYNFNTCSSVLFFQKSEPVLLDIPYIFGALSCFVFFNSILAFHIFFIRGHFPLHSFVKFRFERDACKGFFKVLVLWQSIAATISGYFTMFDDPLLLSCAPLLFTFFFKD